MNHKPSNHHDSPELDHLFDQARQSLKADMPVTQVRKLIHKQASPSLWTNQKFWIMSTSLIGIIALSSLFFWNSSEQPTTIAAANTTTKITTPKLSNEKPPTTTIRAARPDNLPLPIINPILAKTIDNTNLTAPKASFTRVAETQLDSLGPKESFTEYTLEIKKENSEQEIKKLKSELAQYGIHMDVKILTYNNENNIKRFKGQFKTDSLFCGSNMSNYEFDVSGSFKKMQFTFRVANNKNLKYLKIQSDDFEETIECYDDEVIANAQEAQKINERIQDEMRNAEEAMVKAQEKMVKAQEEMIRLRENMLFKNDSFPLLENWSSDQINESWLDSYKDSYNDLLKDYDFPRLELHHYDGDWKEALKDLKIELKDMREQIIEETLEHVRERKEMLKERRLEREMEREIEREIRRQIECERRCEKEDEEESIEALKREAKELEKVAEKLRKAAEKKEKELLKSKEKAKEKAKEKEKKEKKEKEKRNDK